MIEILEITTYSSASVYKQGFFKIIKNMVKDIYFSREIIKYLFLRDFKARYRQSLLGWLWIFLMPLITMGTFLLLNMSGVIRIGIIPVPYPIFGLLGFSFWQLFSNGWVLLSTSVVGAGALVSQIKFSKELLIISLMGQVIIDLLIRIALVLVVYLIYRLTPSYLIILFPIFILPLIALTLGLGFLASLLNIIIRDTATFISVAVSFFLFLMPIMYTMPEKGLLAQINKYNPIYYLISTPRDMIISGKINDGYQFLLSSFFALTIFFIGWFIFYISQSKIAERV